MIGMARPMKLRGGEWVVVAGAVFIGAFAALVGTVIYVKPPPAEFGYADSPAAQRGEAVYRRESCRDCHKVFGSGSTSGPRLDGVGSRRSQSWLQAYLQNPRTAAGEKPYRVKMPSYAHLKAEELDALVAYLKALNAPQAVSANGTANPDLIGLVGLVFLVQPGADAGPRNNGQGDTAADAENKQRDPGAQFKFAHDVFFRFDTVT